MRNQTRLPIAKMKNENQKWKYGAGSGLVRANSSKKVRGVNCQHAPRLWGATIPHFFARFWKFSFLQLFSRILRLLQICKKSADLANQICLFVLRALYRKKIFLSQFCKTYWQFLPFVVLCIQAKSKGAQKPLQTAQNVPLKSNTKFFQNFWKKCLTSQSTCDIIALSLKKVVCIAYKIPCGNTHFFKPLKTFSKNSKKVLDKLYRLCYNKRVKQITPLIRRETWNPTY